MGETFQSEVEPGEIEIRQEAVGAKTRTGFASGPGFENLPVEYVEVNGSARQAPSSTRLATPSATCVSRPARTGTITSRLSGPTSIRISSATFRRTHR